MTSDTIGDRRAVAHGLQEYFAEVDEDYILDRFNLTGLNGEVVQEYSRALDLITDSLGQSGSIARSACESVMLMACR